jgi:hypothetical protein
MKRFAHPTDSNKLVNAVPAARMLLSSAALGPMAAR